MKKFIESSLAVAALLVMLAIMPAYGQNNDRARQEQAAERSRQAQARAADQRAREDTARAAANKAANDNRNARDRQQAAANGGGQGARSFPPPPPISRVPFAPRPGSGGGGPTVNRPGPTFPNIGRPLPPGAKFSSGGISNVARKPTPAEEKRGFTGRFSADGRALVKAQGRVYLVPASRIGVRVPQTAANQNSVSAKWSPQKQASVNADIRNLLSGGSGKSSGGGAGTGKPGLTPVFNAEALAAGKIGSGSTYSPHIASRILAAQAVKASPSTWKVTISSERISHILFGSHIVGEKGGGGHLYGIGNPDKSEFPKNWSERKIIDSALKIANTSEPIEKQDDGRTVHQGTEDGINIRVVVGKDAESIVSAFPTNTPKNPKR